jgi:hypothetical protein
VNGPRWPARYEIRGRVSPMVRMTDRVGALGGILRLEPTTIRAEIPCA